MKKIAVIIFLFFTGFVFSQQEASNWYFGGNAGIKFHSDGSVTPLTDGKLNTNEGCASISPLPHESFRVVREVKTKVSIFTIKSKIVNNE